MDSLLKFVLTNVYLPSIVDTFFSQDGGLRHICDGLKCVETRERSALSALVLWNNRLTGASMDALANALVS